jgi:hypothetical protein
MDKCTLNEKQLDQLRMFIRRRGFRDDMVVEEILDHFACKVEELLTKQPELPFFEAMERAHRSFGAAGFRPVVAAFEKQLAKKYRRLFWSHIKHILLSPVYLPALLIAGYFMYQAFLWADAQGYAHIIGINDLVGMTWLGLMIHEIILAKQFTTLSSEAYKAATSTGDPLLAPMIVGTVVGTVVGAQGPPSSEAGATWIFYAFITLFILMVILRQIACRHILNRAKMELGPAK